MRAISVADAGESLTWGIEPDPFPAPDEVLIEVAAAGVNRADLLQRRGNYPPPAGASTILGLECSGTVVAVGTRAPQALLHQTVCALVEGGAYASLCAAPAAMTLPVPEGMGITTAAALPEAAATAWLNLRSVAQVTEGDVVLVQGATSGVGSLAVQFAALLGATVIATAGTEAKRALAKDLGAHHVFDYRDDLKPHVLDATNGHGVDVVLDNLGPSHIDAYAPILALYGQVVVIGTQAGRTGALEAGQLMARQARVLFSSLRRTPYERKSALMRELGEVVWPALTAGRVRPLIDSVFDFPDAGNAHDRVESGGHTGKVLLAMATGRDTDGAHPASNILL